MSCAGRDESKAVAAINSIERSCAAETPHGLGSLEYIHFDLTDLKSCKMATQRLIEKEQRLDIVGTSTSAVRLVSLRSRSLTCSTQLRTQESWDTPSVSL